MSTNVSMLIISLTLMMALDIMMVKVILVWHSKCNGMMNHVMDNKYSIKEM